MTTPERFITVPLTHLLQFECTWSEPFRDHKLFSQRSVLKLYIIIVVISE